MCGVAPWPPTSRRILCSVQAQPEAKKPAVAGLNYLPFGDDSAAFIIVWDDRHVRLDEPLARMMVRKTPFEQDELHQE